MKKFVITWNNENSEECRTAKFYANDKQEAEEIILQFIEDTAKYIIEEM